MDSASPNLPLMGIQPRTKLSIIITRINLCLTAADFKYSSLLSMKDNRIIIINVTDPFCFTSTVRILTDGPKFYTLWISNSLTSVSYQIGGSMFLKKQNASEVNDMAVGLNFFFHFLPFFRFNIS